MHLTKSNRKKAQYFVNLLRNSQSFAPASLQALFQRIEADTTLQWMPLSSHNNVFLHNQCPGKDWVCYEMRDGILEETFYPSYFVKNGYRYEYIGTSSTIPFDWPNRPNLVTLDVKFFLHLFEAYERTEAATERRAAAVRQRAAAAAGQAGAAVSQLPGITSGDAWL